MIDQNEECRWLLIRFYGHLEVNKRKESWNLLESLTPSNTMWCVLGGFNEILIQREKYGEDSGVKVKWKVSEWF